MKPLTYSQYIKIIRNRKDRDPYKITAPRDKRFTNNPNIGFSFSIGVDSVCEFRYLKYLNHLMGKEDK